MYVAYTYERCLLVVCMIIGGFQPFSIIDYPDKTCAIIFCAGCNFRCPFCHNRELVLPNEYPDEINFNDILAKLDRRRGLIDAVEFTGGEPLLYGDILDYIKTVKRMGFLVKVDTNGSFPEELIRIMPHVDYIAMDVKAPFYKYSEATGVTNINTDIIKDSIDIIKLASKNYEFRTTLMKNFFENDDDTVALGRAIMSAKHYYIQRPQVYNMVDPNFTVKMFSDTELAHFKEIISEFVEEVTIR